MFRSSRLSIISAVVAGLGLSALQASAQQARFSLPFEAHWGSAVLEPGDYSLSAPIAEAVPIIHFAGEGKSNMVVPIVTTFGRVSNHSSLELVKVNGVYFIKEYKSGATGKTFSFGVPKRVVESTMASNGATTIAVNEGTK